MNPRAGWFTIIDVFNDLRRETTPALTWSAGAQLRDLYRKQTGALPIKESRPKTTGHGSHCFAIYPPAWKDDAIAIVMALDTEKASQLDMFDMDWNDI
jgi:hypothetical protein